MTRSSTSRAQPVQPSTTPASLTHVELIWREKQIEHWIRFGREVQERILDRRRHLIVALAQAVDQRPLAGRRRASGGAALAPTGDPVRLGLFAVLVVGAANVLDPSLLRAAGIDPQAVQKAWSGRFDRRP